MEKSKNIRKSFDKSNHIPKFVFNLSDFIDNFVYIFRQNDVIQFSEIFQTCIKWELLDLAQELFI